MNVALLMPLSRQLGGGEVMFKYLLRKSVNVGINWHVIFFSDGPLLREVQRDGVSVYVVNTGRLRQPIRFLQAVAAISRIIRKNQCQLVLSWSAKPHLYGSLAGLRARIPSIWYQLGSPDGAHLSLIDRIATLLPAKFIFVLSGMAQKAQARLRPRRRTKLVYPGVDLDRFEKDLLPPMEKAREAIGIEHNGPIIGIVGRLQKWKGMHVLIEAMPRVLEHEPNALCLIVGAKHEMEPDYEMELRSMVEDLGLQHQVTFTGYQRNVPLWMQAMDIVVHASDHEPFGIVIIEAMALGKPVVASTSGGPSEIVTDRVDGLLTPYGDAHRLSDALTSLLSDQQLASRLGRQAAKRAQDFSMATYLAGVTQAILETPDALAAETDRATTEALA